MYVIAHEYTAQPPWYTKEKERKPVFECALLYVITTLLFLLSQSEVNEPRASCYMCGHTCGHICGVWEGCLEQSREV